MGKSEKDGSTLMAIARCLFNETKLPRHLMNNVPSTSAYHYNGIPHRSIGMDTPYHRMYGKHPNLSHLRIIGAKAFLHVEGYKDKMLERACQGIPIGYDEENPCRFYKPTIVTIGSTALVKRMSRSPDSDRVEQVV